MKKEDTQEQENIAVAMPDLNAPSLVSGKYHRKTYVDNKQMTAAKNKAYGAKKTTKDAYTGETIHRSHRAAKNKHKGNASSHQGETDHTVAAKAAYDYAAKLPGITDADVKTAVNRQHNFKEISKKNNTSKGEKSNTQYAKDNPNLSSKAKARLVAEDAKETILVKGELTVKSAGRESVGVAKNVASVNLALVVKGEKDISEAVIDTVKDTVKVEVTAVAVRTATNIVENIATSAEKAIEKQLEKKASDALAGKVAAKVFNAIGQHAVDIAMVGWQCADAVNKYLHGEIDLQDALIIIGENAATTAIMHIGASIGGEIGASIGASIGSAIALGPGTVWGYLIGEVIGEIVGGAIAYIVGSHICAEIAKIININKYVAQKEQIQKQYEAFASQIRQSRIALEQHLEYLHAKHRENIKKGFQLVAEGYQDQDPQKISDALDHICAQFELVTEFSTREEFEKKLEDPAFTFKLGKKATEG